MTTQESLDARRQNSLHRVRRLAYWLDEAIRLPVIGVRVGWDSILGLLPGIGDFAGLILSSLAIVEAVRVRAPKTVLVHMAAITAVDFVIGSIPLIGDLFDVFWKANKRNLRVLDNWLASETQVL